MKILHQPSPYSELPMNPHASDRPTPARGSFLRGMELLVLACALTGCHSTRFGPLLASSTDEPAPIRATFGTPISLAADVATREQPAPIQPVAAQEPALTARDGHGIDLPTALRVAGADSPVVALAEEAVRARLAEQTQARALLFPTLDAGANLRVHRGRFLSGRGVMLDSNLQSLYYGFGADTKGAGTVAVPGVRLVSHLADAWYAPRAAEQRVVQSQLVAVATRNAVLVDVGVAYLELAGAQARLAALQQSLAELGEVERLTSDFAAKKQGRDSDAQRATSERLLVEADAQRRREELEVAAAELARQLDLDPSLRLRAADAAPPLLELVDRQLPIDALIDQAVGNHPEIAAASAEVAVQDIRRRQERARPWLPVIALGFSAGEFGGGSDSGATRLGNFSSRTDLDVLAVWSLQNMGLGNRASQLQTRAQWEIAEAQRLRVIDRVRRQIAEAHAITQARRQEMELARSRVETSQRAYRQEIVRAKNLLARPIEVLASVNQLTAARQDLVRAMVGYSQAQIQLVAALGNEPILPVPVRPKELD